MAQKSCPRLLKYVPIFYGCNHIIIVFQIPVKVFRLHLESKRLSCYNASGERIKHNSDAIYDVFNSIGYFMGYFAWVLFSGCIIYAYHKKKGVRNGFCINCEYETNTMHFWVDAVHKELAVICMLNPFRVQYFPLESVEKIEPVVTYAGKRKEYAYGVYFEITINGKKTSVGVASSGSGEGFSNYYSFFQ